jgi:HAD superfamily hydrolase (TIGR01549 family)
MSKLTGNPPIRGLIFDVDGTLYRQLPVRAAMLCRLLSHCLAEPFDGLQTLRFLHEYRRAQEELRAGGSAADQLQRACERLQIDPRWASECAEKWMTHYPLALIRRAAYRELAPLLAKARTAGLRLGVFSDYPAEQKLQALGIAEYFSAVLSAADVRVRAFKPHPSGLLAVASDLGLQPCEAAYVGDRPEIDAAAAKNAGVRCFILRARQSANVEWTPIPNYEALARLLGL